jgi:FkbM family methyltransferase
MNKYSHIFEYNFFKTDKFIRRFFLRKLLLKNLKENKKKYSNLMAIINYDYISNDVIIDGFYEQKYITVIAKWLQSRKLKNYLFIDIGANLGNHSIFFSKYFKNIIAFEPHKKLYNLLEFNTVNIPNIRIFNFGLSNKNKKSLLYTDESNFGGSTQISFKKGKKSLVLFRKLDSLNLKKRADLIKIDVEGHEENVLKGASNYLKKYSPIILFESQSSSIKTVVHLLKKFNYKKFYSIENYKKKPSLLDNFIYLFSYLFFSRKKYIVPLTFTKKYYPMIIAEK